MYKMTKELEALKRIRQETCPATYMADFDKNECCDVIEQALQRLEAIDNANPSEALEDLEALEQDIKDRVILAEDRQLKLCAVIKQALLKAQEPKHYLKWEDLKKLGKEIKVKLNGAEYLLCKRIVLGFSEFYLYPKGNQRPVLTRSD